MDEFVDRLLVEELVCDIALPHIVKRLKLEELGTIKERKSVLDSDINQIISTTTFDTNTPSISQLNKVEKDKNKIINTNTYVNVNSNKISGGDVAITFDDDEEERGRHETNENVAIKFDDDEDEVMIEEITFIEQTKPEPIIIKDIEKKKEIIVDKVNKKDTSDKDKDKDRERDNDRRRDSRDRDRRRDSRDRDRETDRDGGRDRRRNSSRDKDRRRDSSRDRDRDVCIPF